MGFRVWCGMLAAGVLMTGWLATSPWQPRAISPAAPAAWQRQPAPAEEFEKARRRLGREAEKEKRRQEAGARAEREMALSEVNQDLQKLRENLDALEKKLAETDLEKELPVELRARSQEIEKLAKRIHKNVKRL